MIAAHAGSTASAASLWRAVVDVTSWPDLLPTFTTVEHVCGTPASGVGARYAVTQPSLRPATYEVTRWDPGSAFTWAARLPGLTTTAHHVVEPTDTGSRLSLSLDWSGPLAIPVRVALRSRAERMITLEATTLAQVAQQYG